MKTATVTTVKVQTQDPQEAISIVCKQARANGQIVIAAVVIRTTSTTINVAVVTR